MAWPKAIGRRGSRPTIRDVARAAGVSTATVSNVLSGRRNVASDLSARVISVVADLGYRTDAVAACLRRKKAGIVGLVIPDFSDPFFGGLIAAFERQAHAAGFQLLVASSAGRLEQEAAQICALIGWRAAGLLIVPACDTFSAGPILRQEGAPVILLHRVASVGEFDSVGVENAAAAAEAIRHLVGLGHRRILAAVCDESNRAVQERLEGVAQAFTEAGFNHPCEILLTSADPDAICRRLGQFPQPTAVFALSSRATLACVQAAARCGLAVPHDLSIVGFGDREWMEGIHPTVTAIRQPVEEMAQVSWDLLMRRIGEDVDESRNLRLNCALMVRESSAAVRN